MASCPHGEPDPACCMECLDAPQPPVPRPSKPRATSAPFTSRYRGACEVCDEWWDPDEDIVRIGNHGYAHVDCTVPR